MMQDYLIDFETGEKYELPRDGELVIGRDVPSGRGISLDEKGVSRRHAVISFDGIRFSVKDEESRNGTFLNGEELERGNGRFLRNGDCIAIVGHCFSAELHPERKNQITVGGFSAMTEIYMGRKRFSIIVPLEQVWKHQKRMLEEQAVAGILPVCFMTEGDSERVYYDYDGLLCLTDYGKNRPEMLPGILEQVLLGMEAAEDCLIPESAFSLLPDTIFVKPGTAEVFQACLPYDLYKTGSVALPCLFEDRLIKLIDYMEGIDQQSFLWEKLRKKVVEENVGIRGALRCLGDCEREQRYITGAAASNVEVSDSGGGMSGEAGFAERVRAALESDEDEGGGISIGRIKEFLTWIGIKS